MAIKWFLVSVSVCMHACVRTCGCACVHVSDCITDIRQSLAAPRLISKPDAVPATTSTVSGSGSSGAGGSGGLGELLRKMHSSLVSQIKSVLNHLQVSSAVSYQSAKLHVNVVRL